MPTVLIWRRTCCSSSLAARSSAGSSFLSVLFSFVIRLGYSAIFFEALKILKAPVTIIGFYIAFLVGTLVFHLFGVYWVAVSDCVIFVVSRR